MVGRRFQDVPTKVNQLNQQNSKEIWRYIQQAGDRLVGKLPPSRHHPKGRNPYAHVAICIKGKFGQSYKEIPDEKIKEVIDYIDYLVENPN
tara:strand:- start:324 stop:596 length:273 start_codon:yes stop_codon:yes gene_type:complete